MFKVFRILETVLLDTTQINTYLISIMDFEMIYNNTKKTWLSNEDEKKLNELSLNLGRLLLFFVTVPSKHGTRYLNQILNSIPENKISLMNHVKCFVEQFKIEIKYEYNQYSLEEISSLDIIAENNLIKRKDFEQNLLFSRTIHENNNLKSNLKNKLEIIEKLKYINIELKKRNQELEIALQDFDNIKNSYLVESKKNKQFSIEDKKFTFFSEIYNVTKENELEKYIQIVIHEKDQLEKEIKFLNESRNQLRNERDQYKNLFLTSQIVKENLYNSNESLRKNCSLFERKLQMMNEELLNQKNEIETRTFKFEELQKKYNELLEKFQIEEIYSKIKDKAISNLEIEINTILTEIKQINHCDIITPTNLSIKSNSINSSMDYNANDEEIFLYEELDSISDDFYLTKNGYNEKGGPTISEELLNGKESIENDNKIVDLMSEVDSYYISESHFENNSYNNINYENPFESKKTEIWNKIDMIFSQIDDL